MTMIHTPTPSPKRSALGLSTLAALAACAGLAHVQASAQTSAQTPAQTAPLRNATPPAAAASAPAAPSPLSAIPATDGRFVLKEVRFSPTRAVPGAELQALVAPFLGKEVDATGLSVIATVVRRAYEERGFGMAGVGYPPQDLTQGVLQIAIVEPQVERVSIEAPPEPPVSAERVTRVLDAAGVRPGEPLDLQALDRAMYTLNDWPGVSAKVTLLPSGDEGKYKVNVQTERRRWWDASVDADSHGSSTSGRYRVGTLLRWNNPGGIGDNLDLRLLASNGAGTTVGRLGYEAPLGATPWRAGLGYSRVGYELGEQFAALGATGTADVVDASISYPVVRRRDSNLVARLGLANKKLRDDIAGLPTTEKTIRAADLTLAFEARSAWGGGGYTGGSVGVQAGRLRYPGEPLPLPAAQPGGFTKLSLQLSRLQALGRGWSVFVGLAGQAANKTLDNAEKFTLGGDKGVRAYPVAEGSSDSGAIVNTELRYWVDPQWSTYAFYDWAHGRDKAAATLSGGTDRRTLRGYGLGVQYTNPDLFTLKASLAVRGNEPVHTEEDNPKTRLLVQIQRSF
ncbi:MAG: ShlB/FhaC/HecB family hemolysin secretion/activation protein [Rhizobacter sp.]|nr:ShlB/FhaC/HecB family hemolysin secretion/activation protein [Rhizobacter sp.]